MLPALIVFFAAQASSVTPPATPTATPAVTPARPAMVVRPTPVRAADPYRPRGLSEIARDRRLGRLSGGGAPVVTTPEPEPVPSGAPSARRPGPVRVEDVQDNGAVTDGTVSVYGTVRNTGRVPACRVRIFLRLYDDHGVLLSTAETTTDLKIVGPGEAVAFGGTIRAPAGLRGSRERKPDTLVNGPAATNWQRVGRVDAEIIGVSEECS
ncbi:MAG TPA: FxLYD domain-containing protein [Thermoanaerobaculia bacterium]|nr:FxLYD domain-containing protein [Thermoanaerobaculia bacterium]